MGKRYPKTDSISLNCSPWVTVFLLTIVNNSVILNVTKKEKDVYTMQKTGSTVKSGIGFGSALAIAISWSVHKSILWAILHGVFSWFYVIYYAITR